MEAKKYLFDDENNEEVKLKLLNNERINEEQSDSYSPSSYNPSIKNQNLVTPIFANLSNVPKKEKKLLQLWIISITYLIFGLIEIVGGVCSNSIAILSDAAHTFSDCFCFLIFILSIYVTKKGTSVSMSFGYHRGEIIGTLVSVTIIWGLSFWLLYVAIMRCITPVRVNGQLMFLIAIAVIVFHLLMGTALIFMGVGHGNSFGNQRDRKRLKDDHFHHSEELSCSNIRGTFKHVITDALQSSIIIIAGVIIYFFPNLTETDPICTFIFTGLVLITAEKTLTECIGILMEGSPIDFDLEKLGNDLLKVKGVIEVHDLHVWSLSIGKITMSCHLTSSTPQISLIKARELMKKKYNITHSTIQVELDTEKIDNLCKHDLHI